MPGATLRLPVSGRSCVLFDYSGTPDVLPSIPWSHFPPVPSNTFPSVPSAIKRVSSGPQGHERSLRLGSDVGYADAATPESRFPAESRFPSEGSEVGVFAHS